MSQNRNKNIPEINTNHVAQMHPTALLPILSPYLKTREQMLKFPTLSRQIHLLFKEKISLNYLLDLIVNYKLTKKEFGKLNETELKSSDYRNPILRVIDKILQQDPSYALKYADVTDGKKRIHTCALEYAYKTKNIALWDLLIKHLQRTQNGIEEAAKLITQLDEKRMRYDLKLMPMISIGEKVEDKLPINRIMIFESKDTRPLVITSDTVALVKKDGKILIYKMINNIARLDKVLDATLDFKNEKEVTLATNPNLFNQIKSHLGYSDAFTYEPSLIKQFDEKGNVKFYIWGELNSEWQLTPLNAEDQTYVDEFEFPNQHNSAVTIKPTAELYQILQKGHNEGYFDLEEFVRLTGAYLEKYSPNVDVPANQWEQRKADSYAIGRAQGRFPKWISQLWCESMPFNFIFDLNFNLKSTYEHLQQEFFGKDFYHANLGFSWAIYKGQLFPFGQCGRLSDPFELVSASQAWRIDLAAMTRLSKGISAKFDNINQLLSSMRRATNGVKCP